jgi:hypothetical protein
MTPTGHKRDDFAHKVGDEVTVSPPHYGYGIYGVVTEQIAPFKYPHGSFNSSNLIYMPMGRKWGTTTRKLSYMVKMKNDKGDGDDLFFWVTKDCIGMPPQSISGTKHKA